MGRLSEVEVYTRCCSRYYGGDCGLADGRIGDRGIGDAGYEICVTDSEKKGTFSLKQSYHIPCLMSAVDSISMKFSDIFLSKSSPIIVYPCH